MRRVVGLALLGLIPVVSFGCSSEAPAQPANVTADESAKPQASPTKKPGSRIYEFRPEAPGTHCSDGGQALLTGTDDNGDGSLSASEITSVQYICNGAPGKTPLIATRAEPIGTACPTGGQAISWGYDDNRNTVLDAGEIVKTTFVCNGANGTNGTNGSTSLVTVIPQSPNAQCPTGGQGIYSGLDVDGDGLLQPGEVKNTSFVCNGANGANGDVALVRTVAEPAGVNCANGGVRVSSGVDGNGDGILADVEATSTAFVCHGAPGIQGPQGIPGVDAAFAITPEDPGVNCAAGGFRIDVGPDANANGVLDATEIAHTRWVCNGVDGGAAAGIPVLATTKPVGATALGCPLGGVEVSAGPDATGNGALDASEITTTVRMCNVTRGKTPNVCSDGRLYVDVGLDRNQNGVLDADEPVDATTCVSGFRAIATGGTSSCAVATDGTAWCWGKNVAGALGDGTTTSRAFPTKLSGLTGVSAIAASFGGHACALLTDGTVRCWGNNTYKQLGAGVAASESLVPVAVTGLVGITSIALGENHSCSLGADGYMRCWGANFQGQVDGGFSGTTTMVNVYAQPSLFWASGIKRIAAGNNRTCFYGSVDGPEVIACLGEPYGFTGRFSSFPNIGLAIASDGCVVTPTGTVECFDTNPWSNAVPLAGVSNATSISKMFRNTCVRRDDGTAQCWGSNGEGQLGNGQWSDTAFTEFPPTFFPVDHVAGIATSGFHTCAVTDDGRAWCSGRNDGGQIGDGTTTQRLVPTLARVILP